MIIDVTDIYISLIAIHVIIFYLISIVVRAILWGDIWYERY